jgi:excinuclease UvrABC nuclease subunit
VPAEITVRVLTLDELAPAITEHFGAPRPLSPTLPAPSSPGVYVWDVDGKVIYIGLAESSLRSRIDLHQSMIRERRTDQSVPNMLRRYQATPNWVVTASVDDAKLLERRLIEWHWAAPRFLDR